MSAKQTCDKYFSLVVRARGACQRCGSRRNLECAHLVRRSFVGDPDGVKLRHNTENALCLCSDCHRLIDTDAVAFTELVTEVPGLEVWGRLVAAKHTPHRRWTEADWVRERQRLRMLLNVIDGRDT